MSPEPQPKEDKHKLELDRNRLAAERTFLSWIRTGLAAVGGGLAITRLLVFNNVTHKIISYVVGELLIFWGMSLFIFALYGFQNICKSYMEMYGYSYNLNKTKIITISLLFICTMILFLAVS
jgi:putative membrane protein